MAFYDELVAATEDARNDLISIPFIQMGSAGQLSLESYTAFLTQAYHHVKHTTPLLMATGGRLPARLEWLREAVGEYIEEEMGHQEWILNDIEACGADKEAVRNGTPSAATELMVAYAYDTIYRNNPVGFFGMVLVLEGTSVALATHAAGNIEQALGLPKTAFSYLNSHGSLDVGHVDFYEKLMNRLDHDEDKQAVIHCAGMVYKLYGDIFRSLPMIALEG
ncbi:iron-containing redox enzyme family protein [Mariprofundus sp. EBB-1]|uniref:TenA family transcriptional regulator n=1 Tax=Mariprofundus sp. EBB-1 TaxID=2650971 RepID=UPI000EF244DD|nr:iron-containing redox enzyme family protein [Mariprofundus sp. EBB-1]RLL50936.1 iron-containing redox enzyme family protein [Mariprofundus sp. EBB-1]